TVLRSWRRPRAGRRCRRDRAPEPVSGAAGPSGARRHVAGGPLGTVPEEVALHLSGKVFARARIGQAQPVLVDEHRLVAQPVLPGLFGYLFVDSLADFAGIGREIQSFGQLAELDAVDHPGHRW